MCGPSAQEGAIIGDLNISHIMKILERLILAHLHPLVRAAQDPLQFAYQALVWIMQVDNVDNAVIYLQNREYSYLDTSGSTVRVMFFEFYSAFNNIWPELLGETLQVMQVDESIISLVMDYLTGRLQFVAVCQL